MKPMIKGICASALALSMAISGVVPAVAAPLRTSVSQIDQSNVIQVQSRQERRQQRREFRQERRQDKREFRQDRRQDKREAKQERRQDRRAARFERRNGHYYYHGHRGYRTYHRGYRQYNGYWFPPAAFVAGAIIGTAIAGSGTRTVSSAHVDWCQNRYRSYRISDDSFQPYNGPRQRCHSPYD